MYGATVGRLGILGISATTNQAVCHIIPDPKFANVRFLFHALSEQVPAIIARGVGGAQPNISQGIIRDLEIPLPPLPEQRRIAEVLDRVEGQRSKRRDALKLLEKLPHAIFTQLFGDPVLDSLSLTFSPLGQICDVRDGTHDTPKYIEQGGYPLVTSKNLTGGFIDLRGASLISESDYFKIYKRSKVDRGDIIMPMIGTIGSPVLVDIQPSFAIKNVALIKFSKSTFSQTYIHHLLSCSYFDYVIGNINRGGTQKFISLGDIRTIPIPCASNESQQIFSRHIANVNNLKAAHRSALTKLDALFASLQHRAFRGEL